MNTLKTEINVTVRVEENGFIVYDDTQGFIELIPKEDQDDVSRLVAAIVENRLNNGNKSSSLW